MATPESESGAGWRGRVGPGVRSATWRAALAPAACAWNRRSAPGLLLARNGSGEIAITRFGRAVVEHEEVGRAPRSSGRVDGARCSAGCTPPRRGGCCLRAFRPGALGVVVLESLGSSPLTGSVARWRQAGWFCPLPSPACGADARLLRWPWRGSRHVAGASSSPAHGDGPDRSVVERFTATAGWARGVPRTGESPLIGAIGGCRSSECRPAGCFAALFELVLPRCADCRWTRRCWRRWARGLLTLDAPVFPPYRRAMTRRVD